MFRVFVFFLTAIASILLMIGPRHLQADQLNVFVSIVPQKYFVKQIGKGLVKIQEMVPPGASPATYEPKPQQMAALAKATAYFSMGVPFEKAWLSKIAAASPGMQIVATDRGVKKMAMAKHAHHHHGHRESHDHHDEGGLDPHIWTSPPLVKILADNISAALKKLDPANAHIYSANHKVFLHELDALDHELHRIFDPLQGLQFMVFHPAWGYFAHTYGLVQVPVEIEGKAPKPAQLKQLINHARAKNIKVIFVQPQFSTKSAQLIARAIDGQVIPADPLAPEWADNLRRQAAQFKNALR